MTVAKPKAKQYYESGFPKEVHRTKHNLMINERLKSARNHKGMSAQGVVDALKKKGISIGHSTLQGYEADEASLNHRYPSIIIIMELAKFYGCSIDYIFGLSDRLKPYELGRETDLRDLLDSRKPVGYKGVKLTKEQRELALHQLDLVFADIIK